MKAPKTVSLGHLNAAVKTALDAAKREHPNITIETGVPQGPSSPLPIYLRFPWNMRLATVSLVGW